METGTATLDRIEESLQRVAGEIRTTLRTRRSADGTENPTGDVQLAADVAADRLLRDRLAEIDGVGSYASEERAEVEEIGDGLSLAVDPLDGSSNLRSNNPVGTIVAAFDAPLPASGRDLVAAWYVLYGPVTTMVGTRGTDTRQWRLADGSVEETERVELPTDPTVYGIGGRTPDWPEPVADLVGTLATDLKLRYGGAMVADVNQVLTYGGLFGYPPLRSAPEGKLRLQFEAIPMAALVEAAGGASTDGAQSLLDVEPDDLHERTPVFVGNDALIDTVETTLQRGS